MNGFSNKFLNGFWNRFLNRLLNRFLNRILNEFLNRFLSGFPNGFLNRFPNLSVHSSFSDSLVISLCYLNGGLLSKFILTLLIFILVYIQGIYSSFFRFGSYLIKNWDFIKEYLLRINWLGTLLYIMKKKLKTQCKIFRYENMFKLIIFKLIMPKIQAPKYYYNCGFWKSDPQWRSISDGYKPGPSSLGSAWVYQFFRAWAQNFEKGLENLSFYEVKGRGPSRLGL